jgi:hypothetical protein
MWSSETSRRAKLGRRAALDERAPAARQSSQTPRRAPVPRPGPEERAAQNALRHGVSSDPALSPHAQAIARRIAGPDAKAEALEQARRIGEAQVDLNRVRARRIALVADPLDDPNYQPLSALKLSVRLMGLVDRTNLTGIHDLQAL